MASENTANQIYEQKCPSCGAPMAFNPQTGRLECEYCGTTAEVDSAARPARAAYPSQKASRESRDSALNSMEPMPVYACISCGAELLSQPESGAMTCPYCGNNIVLTEQFSGTLEPDGIIPFRYKPDDLYGLVKKYYRDKHFLPRGFFSKTKLGQVTGIYVPFWVFDNDISGEVEFYGESSGKTWQDGDYKITHVDEYDLTSAVSMHFDGLAVDASQRMDDALMDSVCPYDMSELVPFKPGYLAGFVADRFDQTSEESRERSDLRALNTAVKVTMRNTQQGYTNRRLISNRLASSIRRARYCLLPMYLFNVTAEGKEYKFAINGQNGKIVGEVPSSKKAKALWFVEHFAIGCAAAAAVVMCLTVL